jgi:RNA polymerase sigma-70 factor, ECF subfamily
MEKLTPAERLAFVLHDMFGVPFDEIATIVERSPQAAAARQPCPPARTRGPSGSRQ